MYQIDFHKPLSIHFIGIGGISMSGLAEILLEEGFTISGSDSKKSPNVPVFWKTKVQRSTTVSALPTFPILFRLLFIQLPSIRTTRNLHVRRKKVSRC